MLLSFLSGKTSAQEGIPFISNYNLPAGYNSQNRAIVQDDQGTMLFANRRGILTHDGSEWKNLDIDIVPYALAMDTVSGRIYVGSKNSYGYIEKDAYGIYEYLQLSTEGKSYGTITNISFSEPCVYFYSHENISIYDPTRIKPEKNIHTSGTESFTGYFLHDSDLYVNISEKGLHFLSGNYLKAFPGGSLFDNVVITFFEKTDASHTLLGTDNSFLYLFNGRNFEDLVLKDEEYFFNAVITGGTILADDGLALATRTGGCVIVDLKTGETRHTINYQSGLPDDEIYCITTDMENGIWLTHEAGATCVDLVLPIKNFNAFKGLDGNLSEAITFNNTLYISTSEGVYYLESRKNFKEKEILVRAPPKTSVQVPHTVQPEQEEPIIAAFEETSVASDTTKRKGGFSRFLSRIFQPDKSEKLPEHTDTAEPPPAPEPVISDRFGTTSQKPEFIRKKVVTLESLTYEFTKIKGLNAKCRQLMVCNNQLFVASNTGLYRIVGDESSFVISDAYIHVIYQESNHPGVLLAGTNTGVQKVRVTGAEILVDARYLSLNWPVYSIYLQGNTLWLGSDSRAIRVQTQNLEKPRLENIYELFTPYSEKVYVDVLDEKPSFFMPSGIYQYHSVSDRLYKIDSMASQGFFRYIFSRDGNIWLHKGLNWENLTSEDASLTSQIQYLRLFDEIKFLYSDEDKNLWVIDGNNNISQIRQTGSIVSGHRFELFIESITNLAGQRFSLSELSLKSGKLPLEFTVSAPFFLRADRTEYQYMIEGMEQPWSSWSVSPRFTIQYLPSGTYTLRIRARNVLGRTNEIQSTSFIIKPPFAQTWLFYVLLAAGFLLLVYIFTQLQERKLLRDKKILESRVEVRTREIERQKEEISRQKEEITDSINYGERIQSAILPPEELLDSLLPEYFILYKPRDIVSGDFYWIAEKSNKVLIAIIDCTGHGVPGAFMSFLGYSLLTEIGNNYKVTTASSILNRLRTNLKHALHQTGSKDEANDGMDMGLCILDRKSLSMQYAGAYNPLYLIRNNRLIEVPGDKMPIGVHLGEEKSFTNNTIQLEKDDAVYMFTDGYTDQFGGEKNKKYKIVPFREYLISIHEKIMKNQKKLLEKELHDWMGDKEQDDDILVFGMRV